LTAITNMILADVWVYSGNYPKILVGFAQIRAMTLEVNGSPSPPQRRDGVVASRLGLRPNWAMMLR